MGGVVGKLFGGSSVPKTSVPDPKQIIDAQRIDTFNPFGALQYGAGKDSARINLTPEMQNMVDSIIGQFGETGDFTQGLQDRTLGRLNQDFDIEEKRLMDTLVQGGHTVGADVAPGAVSELDIFQRNRNDSMIDALLRGEMAGAQMGSNAIGQLQGIGSLLPQVNIGDVTGAYQLNQNAQQMNANNVMNQNAGKNQLIGDLAMTGVMVGGGLGGWFK